MSKVWRYGDHVDTDVIIPARYLNISDFNELAEHAMEDSKENLVVNFAANVKPGDIVVAGNVGSVDNGMTVTVYGHMVKHPSYGEQFKAESCEASLPQDTAGLLSYLSSGVLPYIGPSTARRIVERFGEDTLTVISETPHTVCVR